MKHPRPLYPPLIALFPALSLYAANLSLVPLHHLWRPLGLILAVSLTLWLVLGVVLRSASRGAIAATIVFAAVFGFSTFSSLATPIVGEGAILYVWLAVSFMVLALAIIKLDRAVPLLNVLGALLFVSAVGRVAFEQVAANRYLPTAETSASRTSRGHATRPDIFYIVLDGYGRSDSLQKTLGFDNSDFIRELENRGFYVAKASHANYCQTELSIASALNLAPIPDLLPNVTPETSDRLPLSKLIDENRVGKELGRLGYTTVAVTTGFPGVRFAGSDVRLRRASAVSLYEIGLLRMTPFGAEQWTAASMFDQRRKHILNAFQNLEHLATPGGKPKFVQAHILAPHPPFVFEAEGGKPIRRGPFGFWDGSDYMTHVGSEEDYRSGYAGQATYLNKLVLRTLDRLLADQEHQPIIIIQGDHGSKLKLDQNSIQKTDLNEVFPILNAYRLPDDMMPKLYPGITPLNSFRLILGQQFGMDLPLLPDRSWYSTYPLPYKMTDITSLLR